MEAGHDHAGEALAPRIRSHQPLLGTVLAALGAALDRAEAEAGAVVVAGRPGRFSGGFDLSIMREGGDATRSLVGTGAELLLRLWESPIPVVAACTGAAVAAGALAVGRPSASTNAPSRR